MVWDFETDTVTENLTLYAGWEMIDAHLTMPISSFASLELQAKEATNTISGYPKIIPGAFYYEDIDKNLTFNYQINAEDLEDVNYFTRAFRITKPDGASAFMLATEGNYAVWNVLDNRDFPEFQYSEQVGGNLMANTMKNFFYDNEDFVGYWGNSYSGNAVANVNKTDGNMVKTWEFMFGADAEGFYTINMDIVNLEDGSVIETVTRVVRVVAD